MRFKRRAPMNEWLLRALLPQPLTFFKLLLPPSSNNIASTFLLESLRPLFTMADMRTTAMGDVGIAYGYGSGHQRHKFRHIYRRVTVSESAKTKRKTKSLRDSSFQNDLFKLTAELRNEIYEYVLHEELQYESRTVYPRRSGKKGRGVKSTEVQQQREVQELKPRHIRSGTDNEPALFDACRQVRKEAIGIYYRLNAFVIEAKVTQMASVEKWISSIRAQFESPKQPDRLAFVGLGLQLHSLRWEHLLHFGQLARLA